MAYEKYKAVAAKQNEVIVRHRQISAIDVSGLEKE